MLNQQRRCFICLKVGHVSKDCPSSQKKSCYYCGKKDSHNRCLCPQKFTRQVTESFVTFECNVFSDDAIDATTTHTESVRETMILLILLILIPLQCCWLLERRYCYK